MREYPRFALARTWSGTALLYVLCLDVVLVLLLRLDPVGRCRLLPPARRQELEYLPARSSARRWHPLHPRLLAQAGRSFRPRKELVFYRF